jgi:hypothetical protein
MDIRLRRIDARVLTTLIAGSVLLLGAPALAHPFVVGGGRVPVQSLATIELDLAHGCGVEGAGDGPDTDEVALEVPEWLRIVEVAEPDGWRVTIEDATGTRLGTVVWTATFAEEPAPRFLLDVVVDGEPGETRHLRVSQRCGALVERWVGTPDAPAEQPAVRLRLEAPDPERPAPPSPQPEHGPGPGPEPEQGSAAADGSPPAPELQDEARSDAGGAQGPLPQEPSSSRDGARDAGIAAAAGALAIWAAVRLRRRPDGGRALGGR